MKTKCLRTQKIGREGNNKEVQEFMITRQRCLFGITVQFFFFFSRQG